ncbi:hypothetical protein Thena_0867 [Thermodesulfobium narugense DSM 14796]|uniref:Uncharacterized protein n=1 Tax=Thermodesulfobium narugense DSM 14796 TaxID=747365 RepID=M1E4S9_9BACT|nr:hypothetical protein [Thermodesulfobium narugense]AEE14497.1 hypothetical protein Thena_0867 [Thermodesulfobium narugense DSM 14796]
MNSFKLYTVIMIVFLTLNVGCKEAWAVNWVYFATDNVYGNQFFYDADSVNYLTQNIIEVNYKELYSEAGKNAYISILKSHNISTYGYDLLSYTIVYLKVDLKNNLIMILSFTDYNKNGDILYFDNIENPNWDYVQEGTIGRLLIEAIKSNKNK